MAPARLKESWELTRTVRERRRRKAVVCFINYKVLLLDINLKGASLDCLHMHHHASIAHHTHTLPSTTKPSLVLTHPLPAPQNYKLFSADSEVITQPAIQGWRSLEMQLFLRDLVIRYCWCSLAVKKCLNHKSFLYFNGMQEYPWVSHFSLASRFSHNHQLPNPIQLKKGLQ